MKLALLPAVAALLSASSFAQKTIHVPGDQLTIQSGIAVASAGDTVLVDPGAYQERIDFLGKAITVRSAQGPQVTTITAAGLISGFPTGEPQSSWRVVRFISGEGSSSVLEGFTITSQDQALTAGGIYCVNAAPVVRNCIVRDIHGGVGAGIWGNGLFEDCQILRNGTYSAAQGAGVYGSPTMLRCEIAENIGDSGAGVFGAPTMTDCVIRDNQTVEAHGGGLYATEPCVIDSCVFDGNYSGNGHVGGGVYGPAILSRCIFTRNECSAYLGYGISAIYGATSVDRCSVQGNTIGGFVNLGGAIGPCGPVTNSIVWDNQFASFSFDFLSTVSYCCVEGGYPGLGNTSSNPLLLDPPAGGLQLLPDSPCIDAGDPSSPLDEDGTRADMGAFPFNQYPICVTTKVPVAAKIAFDHVGSVIAARGPYVIAGTPDVNGPGFESGAAFLAYRDGPAWVALPKLVASDESANAMFGASVALDADVAWIGAPGVSAEAGATYVFRQQEDGAWAEEIKLMASDGTSGSRFGSRVTVQGAVAAASAPLANAPGADSGAVYVFKDGVSGWTEIAKLMALDGAAGDHFGSGLAISGSRMLIGAEGDASGAGSAYVFEDAGFGWGQQAKLIASDASANEQFGHAVGLEGDVAVITAPAADSVGAAYVFKRTGFIWTQQQKLVASTPFQNAEFGCSVALAGNRIVVGARSDDGAASNAGAAFLFEFNGTTWVQTQKYTLPGAQTGDAAGSGVALSGDYILVGAEWADDPELDSGELWAFAAPGTCLPKLKTVPGAQAQDPAAVTAIGTYLGQVQQITIGGVPVPLISATDTSLTYQPQPDDPGFLPLTVSGSEGAGSGTQQLYPSLAASTTGVGGTLKVNLDNGIGGLYVLAMGFQALPSPISIVNPPSWYGVLLNPAAPLFVISQGAFATSAPIALTYNVPSDPLLVGFHLYFQAWCQQGFFGPEVTYSFTNMAGVTL